VRFENKDIVKYVKPKEAAAQPGVHVRTLAYLGTRRFASKPLPGSVDNESYTASPRTVWATVIYARVPPPRA